MRNHQRNRQRVACQSVAEANALRAHQAEHIGVQQRISSQQREQMNGIEQYLPVSRRVVCLNGVHDKEERSNKTACRHKHRRAAHTPHGKNKNAA